MKLLTCLFCCAGIFFALTPLKGEAPSDFPWKAHWIGPASGSSLDLAGANWIWSDDPGVDPVKNAPACTREFTATVVIPAGGHITGASAVFTADDSFELSVNGKSVGAGDSWKNPLRIDLSSVLHAGSNALGVTVVNGPSSGAVNAAGLIGKIRINLEGGAPLEIVTDSTWVCQERPVRVIGPLGSGPWGNLNEESGHPGSNLWTAYRKSFDLAQKPASAPARIAVDSKYWLWINGNMVVREGGLKRGPNRTDSYFDVVDLAPYLVKGHNQIAVLSWFFGRDGFSHKNSGTPGFHFELETPSGSVISDASWKTLRHPSFGEAARKSNFRLAESSVHFDARLEPQGWTEASFDDSAWAAATDHDAPPAAPWNKLWERPIPQWKDYGLKDYVNTAELAGGKGTLTAKLPYNAQVTPWLRVSAPAGRLIRMHTDNALCDIQAEYLTREGEQEFETPAWMSGHAVIYDIPDDVRVIALKYRESGFNTEFTGTFNCDDDFLNTLWGKCRRTLYINMRDTFFDCPDRERAAWWGDIVIQLGQVFHTFDPAAHTLIRKCMYNLVNWQNPSKTLFAPIPAGNWNKELPQQMLASIGQYGFWTYYLHTGDKQTLADIYPHVSDYLSIWQTDANGLIVHRSGENGWDWADWGENVDLRVLDQAWFCLALEGAAHMADELGNAGEASAYREKRQAVIDAVNAHFWNGQAYRNPDYKGATDDRAQGMAVIAGFVSPDKFPAIRAELAKSFHASPYLEKYILESLFLMDAPDAALERLRSRYKEMVGSETSTLWELFSRADGTINHAWTGGPLTLLYEQVAGVAPTSPGYATYRVSPRPGSLKHIEAGFDSVKGRIEVKIDAAADSFGLRLKSPAGTLATVSLPLGEPARAVVKANGVIVWQNGKPGASVPGLQSGREDGGRILFVASPGEWSFEVR